MKNTYANKPNTLHGFTSLYLHTKPSIKYSSKLQAFTIVELLIVIVVIAILAAIAVAVYGGITNRAYDTAVRSDFANFIKKYETIRVLNSANQYSDPTAAMGFSFSKDAYITGRNNMYLCINPERNQYAISAQSRSGKEFSL